jgi:hypothetical protein
MERMNERGNEIKKMEAGWNVLTTGWVECLIHNQHNGVNILVGQRRP